MMIFPTAGRSLYRRLLLVSIGSAILVWLFLLVWFFWQTTRVGSGFFDRDLRFIADTFATLYSAEFQEPERTRVMARMIEQFSSTYSDSPMRADEIAYRIVDGSGKVLHVSDPWPELAILQERGVPVTQGNWRTLVVTGKQQGVQVQIAIGQSFIQRALGEILVFFLLPLIAALPVIMILLRFGIRNTLRPLFGLANAIAEWDLRSGQPIMSKDADYRELKPIFESINALLARIAMLRDHERHFFSDAAHELRTPLATIGAQAHVLVNAQGIEVRSIALQHLNNGIERVADLVTKLLTLSRLDAESASVNSVALDLALLARTAVARHAPRTIDGNFVMYYEGPTSLMLDADHVALESLLDNLLENALRHCPVGSTVAVVVERCYGAARLAVIDDGPGIPIAWRTKVQSRFVRLPGTEASGSGLGLAIVSRITDLHGGTLLLANGLNGRGLSVEIRLPC